MWDPISLLYCMWILNVGLPDARLSVKDVVEAKEQKTIIDTITNSIKIREGV